MSVFTQDFTDQGYYSGASLPPELLKILNSDITGGLWTGPQGGVIVDGKVYNPVFNNGLTGDPQSAGQPQTLTGWESMAVGAGPGGEYTTYDTSGQGGYAHPILTGGSFNPGDFKDLGQAVLTVGSMYAFGQGLEAAGVGGSGADTVAATADPALTVQGNSINALDASTGVGYGSDPELTSLASSDTAFSKALSDAGLTTSQLSSAGITSADIASALKGGYLTQLLAGAASLITGNKGKDAANTALQQGDPFGKYRGYFGDQLMQLETDPSKITSTPGYKTGIDAITRTQAANGYLGSGNMMTSLMDYGQSFFANRESQLANLAGSNINPNAAIAAYLNTLSQSNATTNNGIIQLIRGAMGLAGGLDLSGLGGSGT